MLMPKPLHSSVAMINLSSFSEVPGMLAAAKSELSEILSAFEFIDARSMRVLRECNVKLASSELISIQVDKEGECGDGISGNVVLLIEVSGSEESVSERLQTFMGRKLNLENDSVLIASNKSQEREMWAMRESHQAELAKDKKALADERARSKACKAHNLKYPPPRRVQSRGCVSNAKRE